MLAASYLQGRSGGQAAGVVQGVVALYQAAKHQAVRNV